MSDTSVERLEAPITHTHIGGQAVLEGIMMRGRLNWAIAVRLPDGGIYTEQHDLHSATKDHAWMRWPLVRGVVALVETMSLAMKAFAISAEKSGETEEEQLSSAEISWALVLGAVMAVVLFIIAPAILTNLMLAPIVGDSPATRAPFLWNMVDGVLRVAAFFLYIWAISRMEDIQRVFAYHGAEHKTIHAYEHGVAMEPAAIQAFSTKHVRCGTSFLLMVMVVSIIVFSLVPIKAMAAGMGIESRLAILGIVILSRIVLIPLVAGLAYEITVKWAGSHPDNPFVQFLLWPGLQLQRMTTREPDDSMIEIAVAAMQPIIDRESPAETPAQVPTVEPGGA